MRTEARTGTDDAPRDQQRVRGDASAPVDQAKNIQTADCLGYTPARRFDGALESNGSSGKTDLVT